MDKENTHQIYHLIFHPIPNESFDDRLHEDFIGWYGGKPYGLLEERLAH